MIYSIKEVNMKVEKFKSLIKESIREVLVEDGLLKEAIASAISETHQVSAEAMTEAMSQVHQLRANLNSNITEQNLEDFREQTEEHQQRSQKNVQKMQELRNRMMDSIGKSSYKDLYNLEGLDLFEGTTPLGRGGTPGESAAGQGPLSGIEPDDAGVAIDSLLGNKKLWQQLMKK
jgi:hypothetical protein